MASRREVPFFLTAENRTQAAFRELRRDVGRVTGLARGLAGAFGVGLGAGAIFGITRGVSSAIDEIDELQKKSRELETTLEDLGRIQIAGDILGFGDQVERLLTRIQAARSDALTSPDSRTAQAFDSIGLSFERLRDLSPSEVFRELVDALNASDDAANNAAIAYAIAGTRLQGALLRAAEAGPQQLANLESAFDGIGGVSEETAERVEELNDSLRILAQIGFSEFANALNSVLPAVEEFREGIADIRDAVGRFRQQGLAETALDAVQFISPLRIVSDAIKDFVEDDLGIDTSSAARSFNDALVSIVQAAPASIREQLARNLEEGLAFLDIDLDQPLSQAASGVAQISDELNASNEELFNLRIQTDDLNKKLIDQINAEKEANEERRRALELTRQQNELAQLTSSALNFLRPEREEPGRARVGAQGDFESAVARSQRQAVEDRDPAVRVLERIQRVLEQDEAERSLRRIVELIESNDGSVVFS